MGLFGTGPLWMTSPTAGNERAESSPTQLAETAVKPSLQLVRKVGKLLRHAMGWIAWRERRRQRINPRRICNTSRKKGGRKCIHRFEADAPDAARNRLIQIARCQFCKLKDRMCRHTYYPVAQCGYCGIDCRFCAHQ